MTSFYTKNNQLLQNLADPNIEENPEKNFANKHFYKILVDPSFNQIHKLIQSNNWYFSFIKNLRFKSKLLPGLFECTVIDLPWKNLKTKILNF